MLQVLASTTYRIWKNHALLTVTTAIGCDDARRKPDQGQQRRPEPNLAFPVLHWTLSLDGTQTLTGRRSGPDTGVPSGKGLLTENSFPRGNFASPGW